MTPSLEHSSLEPLVAGWVALEQRLPMDARQLRAALNELERQDVTIEWP